MAGFREWGAWMTHNQEGPGVAVSADLLARNVRAPKLIPPRSDNRRQFTVERKRLADASIMRAERAATAKARAERLGLANGLMRETLDRLGAIETLDAFLGGVLL